MFTNNLKIIFIHGNGGNSWSYLWTPWLKYELQKLNLNVIFETFPDSILARREYWLPYLKDKLKANEKTLLIGHSSGAVAAMRYAQDNKIYGSILISPCYTDLGIEDEKQSGWYKDPWDWNAIKNNQKVIGLFYSKNDQLIPLKEFIHIRDNLKPNNTFEFEHKGHFINQNDFIELLDYIKTIIKN